MVCCYIKVSSETSLTLTSWSQGNNLTSDYHNVNDFSDIGTFVYLCDFHKEQAWDRWLSASHNQIPKERKDELRALFRQISRARSDKECQDAIKQLKVSVDADTV